MKERAQIVALTIGMEEHKMSEYLRSNDRKLDALEVLKSALAERGISSSSETPEERAERVRERADESRRHVSLTEGQAATLKNARRGR